MTLLDIPRWYTGLAEWMACLVYASQLRPRITGKRRYGLMGLGLAVQCLFLEVTDDIALYLWIPCMVAAGALMLVLLMLLCDIDIHMATYTTTRAFILAEFTAALQWQIHCYLWPGDDASKER